MVANAIEADPGSGTDSGDSTQREGGTTGSESNGGFTVTAHLRASPTGAAARRQQAVLEQLRALEAEGTIPDLTVERWGSRVNVPVSERDDSGAVALYEEFERAAEAYGLQLEPFFESRKAVGGLLSSGPPTERVIVFPVVSITIRRDGDLAGLYPCWSDGDHHSVEDCLDALMSGGDGGNLA